MPYTDIPGLLDRLEIAISRLNKPEIYSPSRCQKYHDLAQKQIKYLRTVFPLVPWED
ncbi:MAG: hypothetical protein AAF518_14715 [Spirochaetota bacterium]